MPRRKVEKVDTETEKVLSDQEKIKLLTEHEGWGLVRMKLINEIYDLQTAFSIEGDNAEAIVLDLKARKMAVNILYAWLKDVEGTASQYDNNKELVRELRESYIHQIPE